MRVLLFVLFLVFFHTITLCSDFVINEHELPSFPQTPTTISGILIDAKRGVVSKNTEIRVELRESNGEALPGNPNDTQLGRKNDWSITHSSIPLGKDKNLQIKVWVEGEEKKIVYPLNGKIYIPKNRDNIQIPVRIK